MPRRVICISYTTLSGGDEVGRLVSDRLGLRYVDTEIVAVAAEKEGVDPQLVADVERRRSLLGRLLVGLGRVGAIEAYGGSAPQELSADASDDFRALIREAIHETAERGDVVVVAHAASFALGPGAGVLRVFVTASPERRRRRSAASEGPDAGRAAKEVERQDAARAAYLARFYGVTRELPTHYDLVLNTDTIPVEHAAEIVLEAASK